jgi:RNA-directed DNA polymerase
MIKNSYRVNIINCKNIKELAQICFCNQELLVHLVAKPSYTKFSIPKKAGGKREISAPGLELKYVQKQLLYSLSALYVAPAGVHGFVAKYKNKRYTILSNAKQHLGKKWVWNLDIESFFSSIQPQMVWNRFRQKPFLFSESKSTFITLLLVHQKQLPTGSPCSPVVSNLVCQNMDDQIIQFIVQQNELFPEANLVYTRYADDITISSNLEITATQKAFVYACLNQMGFAVNAKKERMQSSAQAQWVTGIKVNEKPNLDRKYIRNIRATLHQIRSQGLDQTVKKHFNINTLVTQEDQQKFLNILHGKINHIGFVKGKNNAVYLKYKKEFLAVLG